MVYIVVHQTVYIDVAADGLWGDVDGHIAAITHAGFREIREPGP
jgi:hypothetical protein